jgi:uncharacterized protein (DUF3820 family)
MNFKEAAAFVMPLGKYRGKKLDDIAKTSEGLLYLDWLRGMRTPRDQIDHALKAYLEDTTINDDLMRAM